MAKEIESHIIMLQNRIVGICLTEAYDDWFGQDETERLSCKKVMMDYGFKDGDEYVKVYPKKFQNPTYTIKPFTSNYSWYEHQPIHLLNDNESGLFDDRMFMEFSEFKKHCEHLFSDYNTISSITTLPTVEEVINLHAKWFLRSKDTWFCKDWDE